MIQDFGWHRNVDGNWSAANARRPKEGHMYINPQRQVALYFFPNGTYYAFRARIEKVPIFTKQKTP